MEETVEQMKELKAQIVLHAASIEKVFNSIPIKQVKTICTKHKIVPPGEKHSKMVLSIPKEKS